MKKPARRVAINHATAGLPNMFFDFWTVLRKISLFLSPSAAGGQKPRVRQQAAVKSFPYLLSFKNFLSLRLPIPREGIFL